MLEIIRWVLVIISIPLIVLLARHARRSARALSERIDEYHEEEDSGRNVL
ncbi:MAG: hypothetical protein ABFD54_10070 [Armatimonadota bacterium]|nr:hypothetical protein [bacterium]